MPPLTTCADTRTLACRRRTTTFSGRLGLYPDRSKPSQPHNRFVYPSDHIVSFTAADRQSTTQPFVGYRTMHKCSHRVKSKTVAELLKIALIRSDKRRATCALELCICYFSGFWCGKGLDGIPSLAYRGLGDGCDYRPGYLRPAS